tara:strand:- start:101 stop:259 length:159 start_codon:yes stop_codon:yes gene_type:complete
MRALALFLAIMFSLTGCVTTETQVYLRISDDGVLSGYVDHKGERTEITVERE